MAIEKLESKGRFPLSNSLYCCGWFDSKRVDRRGGLLHLDFESAHPAFVRREGWKDLPANKHLIVWQVLRRYKSATPSRGNAGSRSMLALKS